MRKAVEDGMADAWAEFDTFKKDKVDTDEVTSAQFFGTAADLKGNYLYRMAGAVLGIYGNTAAEAHLPASFSDSTGAPLTGANNYVYKFAKDQLPPVNAFWSLTMYELPQSLLVANPINRYLINSPMLPSLVPDKDGGYTFYVQNESPGIGQGVQLAARAGGSVRRWCCGCTGPSPMRSTAPGQRPSPRRSSSAACCSATRGCASSSATAEARPAAAQVALELGGQRVAVDLAQRLGHVDLGVAALFEGRDVLGDLLVLGRHLGDRLLPLLGLGRQVGQRHLDVEDVLDAAQQRHGGLRVRRLRDVVRHRRPERHRGNARRDAGVLEHARDARSGPRSGSPRARRTSPSRGSRRRPKPAPAGCAGCRPAARRG